MNIMEQGLLPENNASQQAENNDWEKNIELLKTLKDEDLEDAISIAEMRLTRLQEEQKHRQLETPNWNQPIEEIKKITDEELEDKIAAAEMRLGRLEEEKRSRI